MIKFIGAICFILGGFFLGNSLNGYYKNKVVYWQEVLSFLNYCRSEITHNSKDINSILIGYGEKKGKFSGMISQSIQYNTTIDEEQKFLTDFFSEITSVDFGTQNKVFDNYMNEATKKLEKAKSAQEKKGKTYFKLMPLLCLGIVIFVW